MKKLELVKHTPHEPDGKVFYTVELDGKNCFPQVPLGSIQDLEQANMNYDAVKNFRRPVREVIKTDEVSHD